MENYSIYLIAALILIVVYLCVLVRSDRKNLNTFKTHTMNLANHNNHICGNLISSVQLFLAKIGVGNNEIESLFCELRGICNASICEVKNKSTYKRKYLAGGSFDCIAHNPLLTLSIISQILEKEDLQNLQDTDVRRFARNARSGLSLSFFKAPKLKN